MAISMIMMNEKKSKQEDPDKTARPYFEEHEKELIELLLLDRYKVINDVR